MAYFCDASSFSSGFLTGFWTSFTEFYICIIFIAILLCGLAAYCIKSFGMYKMAQIRNLDSAYLAWFPFARQYLFGKISDDINKHKNIQSSNRVILLSLSILNGIATFILGIFLFISLAEIIGAASTLTISFSYDYYINLWASKFNSFIVIITIMAIISLLFNIFYCIYANNVFKDYVPKISALLCTIIVLNVFIFHNNMLVDSVIFLSISTNEPESLKPNNQSVY